MQLTYLNPTHTLIVAHLDAGETLGTLEGGEHGATHYIKVDGSDPNYVELVAKDPQLESVDDPGEVKMPPPQEAPPAQEPGTEEGKPHPDHPEQPPHPDKPAAAAAPAKPAAPAAHAAPKPAAPPPTQHKR